MYFRVSAENTNNHKTNFFPELNEILETKYARLMDNQDDDIDKVTVNNGEVPNVANEELKTDVVSDNNNIQPTVADDDGPGEPVVNELTDVLDEKGSSSGTTVAPGEHDVSGQPVPIPAHAESSPAHIDSSPVSVINNDEASHIHPPSIEQPRVQPEVVKTPIAGRPVVVQSTIDPSFVDPNLPSQVEPTPRVQPQQVTSQAELPDQTPIHPSPTLQGGLDSPSKIGVAEQTEPSAELKEAKAESVQIQSQPETVPGNIVSDSPLVHPSHKVPPTQQVPASPQTPPSQQYNAQVPASPQPPTQQDNGKVPASPQPPPTQQDNAQVPASPQPPPTQQDNAHVPASLQTPPTQQATTQVPASPQPPLTQQDNAQVPVSPQPPPTQQASHEGLQVTLVPVSHQPPPANTYHQPQGIQGTVDKKTVGQNVAHEQVTPPSLSPAPESVQQTSQSQVPIETVHEKVNQHSEVKVQELSKQDPNIPVKTPQTPTTNAQPPLVQPVNLNEHPAVPPITLQGPVPVTVETAQSKSQTSSDSSVPNQQATHEPPAVNLHKILEQEIPTDTVEFGSKLPSGEHVEQTDTVNMPSPDSDISLHGQSENAASFHDIQTNAINIPTTNEERELEEGKRDDSVLQTDLDAENRERNYPKITGDDRDKVVHYTNTNPGYHGSNIDHPTHHRHPNTPPPDIPFAEWDEPCEYDSDIDDEFSNEFDHDAPDPDRFNEFDQTLKNHHLHSTWRHPEPSHHVSTHPHTNSNHHPHGRQSNLPHSRSPLRSPRTNQRNQPINNMHRADKGLDNDERTTTTGSYLIIE